jgi:hypothetical protein
MLKHKLMFGAAVLLTAVSVAGSAYANVATGWLYLGE